MSVTPLPHNGEAQLAEVRSKDGNGSSIFFDGRSRKDVGGNPKAVSQAIGQKPILVQGKFIRETA